VGHKITIEPYKIIEAKSNSPLKNPGVGDMKKLKTLNKVNINMLEYEV